MTAPTIDAALAIESARGDEYRAQIRAEGFRAGAEAMREAAVKLAELHRSRALDTTPFPPAEVFGALFLLAAGIRSLAIPEERT